MLMTVDYCYCFLFFLTIVSPSLSILNKDSKENYLQNVFHSRGQTVHGEVEMNNPRDIINTNQLHLKHVKEKVNDGRSFKYGNSDQYSVYDIIFLSYFLLFVIFVIYVRVKTHHRVDYTDEDWSFLSLMTRFRKTLAPDGTIEYDLKKSIENKLFANEFLTALAILWFGLSLCNYDELLSDPKKHIEDLSGLLNAMVRYCLYIFGVVYVFDVCLAPPYCYYK